MPSGLSTYGASQAMAAALPNGTSLYVGLLMQIPTDGAGAGLIEVNVAGYERVEHTAWLTTTGSTTVTRANDGSVTFPALEESVEDVAGWAIWDAPSAGNLVAFGSFVDGADAPVTVDFEAGEEPHFPDQELAVVHEEA